MGIYPLGLPPSLTFAGLGTSSLTLGMAEFALGFSHHIRGLDVWNWSLISLHQNNKVSSDSVYSSSDCELWCCIVKIMPSIPSCRACKPSPGPWLPYAQDYLCPKQSHIIRYYSYTKNIALYECVMEVALLKINIQTVPIAFQDGATPLFLASQEGHVTVIRQLLSSGAKVNHPREVRTAPSAIPS